jgi:SPP1 family predicted phage head-tail adaptor
MRGTLRHARNERITIQRRADATQDALGQPSAAWVDLADVWAFRDVSRGSEATAAGMEQAALPVRWQIALRTDVLPDMRITWRGLRFDIKSAVPAGAALDLYTVQGTGDGR